MPHAVPALVLALAVGAINLAELVYFGEGYLPRQVLAIVFWAVLPAPAVYLLGRRFLRSGPAAKVLSGALALALALGAFGLWDVTIGPGRDEPLKGLIVVSVPAFQNVALLAGLLAAWVTQRWLRASASAP